MTEDKFDRVNQADFQLLSETVKSQGYINAEIASGSMEPVLKVGDKIQIKPLSSLGRPLRRFDILAFHNPKSKLIVVHYLWHQNQAFSELFVTRALKSMGDDPPFTSKEILGVVNHEMPLKWKLWITFRFWLRGR